MRRVLLLLVVVVSAWAQESPGAAVIDALAATVGPRVIMMSDVRLARDLRLMAPAVSDADILRRLVDRMLMLAEVERFQQPDPPPSMVDEKLEALRRRAGPEAWASVLLRDGVDEAYVRAIVKDDGRVESYLRQRFGALADPSDEDVRTAYSERQKAGGSVPSLDAMRSSLREELAAKRFQALVDQWVLELRSRGDVSMRLTPAASQP